ncbi:MAG: type III-A CRISPR-associated RAMP protein Csm3 [Chloroflexota bacterium]|nr:MAG: type III-A CRISPR-associated RAMP protein Csm3 [Bellilinea sp.]
MNNNSIQLKGRVLIHFDVVAKTGLHIGGTESGIEIGGVDKTVIRDPLSNRPYIPGSSLRGKMRSLLEKYRGLPQNQRIGQGYIHSCGADKNDTLQTYLDCDVCTTFGVPGERDFATPTRLIVRDVFMDDESARALEHAETDLPYTEVKTEVSIDRVTSAANPRQMERVPAGTRFSHAELVYTVYDGANCDAKKDVQRLKVIVEGLQLLLDDYLGGLGSRGSGKVEIENICLEWRGGKDYSAEPKKLGEFETVAELAAGLSHVQQQILAQL